MHNSFWTPYNVGIGTCNVVILRNMHLCKVEGNQEIILNTGQLDTVDSVTRKIFHLLIHRGKIWVQEGIIFEG